MNPQDPAPQVVPLSSALFGLPSTNSLSPMRIFVSLCVLLVFLTVAAAATRRGAGGQRKKVGVRSSSSSNNKRSTTTVLLVGPLAAGKTSLFSKLLYGSSPPTHTSMKENEGVLKAKWVESTGDDSEKNKKKLDESNDQLVLEDKASLQQSDLAVPVHLVDLPGHPRLRTRSLAQFLPVADGVVFVVDGNTGLGGKQIRDAGEHLQVLLSLLSLLQSSSSRYLAPLPILILLTKSDLGTSSSSPTQILDRARQSLSRELERRRLASSTSSASRSAGARLEGLEAIPSSGGGTRGASSTARAWFEAVLTVFGLGAKTGSSSSSGSVAAASSASTVGLPSDEAEILGNADAFPFEGAFEWDKLSESGLCELSWAIASVKDNAGKRQGTGQVWEWLEKL